MDQKYTKGQHHLNTNNTDAIATTSQNTSDTATVNEIVVCVLANIDNKTVANTDNKEDTVKANAQKWDPFPKELESLAKSLVISKLSMENNVLIISNEPKIGTDDNFFIGCHSNECPCVNCRVTFAWLNPSEHYEETNSNNTNTHQFTGSKEDCDKKYNSVYPLLIAQYNRLTKSRYEAHFCYLRDVIVSVVISNESKRKWIEYLCLHDHSNFFPSYSQFRNEYAKSLSTKFAKELKSGASFMPYGDDDCHFSERWLHNLKDKVDKFESQMSYNSISYKMNKCLNEWLDNLIERFGSTDAGVYWLLSYAFPKFFNFPSPRGDSEVLNKEKPIDISQGTLHRDVLFRLNTSKQKLSCLNATCSSDALEAAFTFGTPHLCRVLLKWGAQPSDVCTQRILARNNSLQYNKENEKNNKDSKDKGDTNAKKDETDTKENKEKEWTFEVQKEMVLIVFERTGGYLDPNWIFNIKTKNIKHRQEWFDIMRGQSGCVDYQYFRRGFASYLGGTLLCKENFKTTDDWEWEWFKKHNLLYLANDSFLENPTIPTQQKLDALNGLVNNGWSFFRIISSSYRFSVANDHCLHTLIEGCDTDVLQYVLDAGWIRIETGDPQHNQYKNKKLTQMTPSQLSQSTLTQSNLNNSPPTQIFVLEINDVWSKWRQVVLRQQQTQQQQQTQPLMRLIKMGKWILKQSSAIDAATWWVDHAESKTQFVSGIVASNDDFSTTTNSNTDQKIKTNIKTSTSTSVNTSANTSVSINTSDLVFQWFTQTNHEAISLVRLRKEADLKIQKIRAHDMKQSDDPNVVTPGMGTPNPNQTPEICTPGMGTTPEMCTSPISGKFNETLILAHNKPAATALLMMAETMTLESANEFLKQFDEVNAANAWVNSTNTKGSQIQVKTNQPK